MFVLMGLPGTPIGNWWGRVSEDPDMMTMKPIAAAAAGALISGVAMYTVGARTATVDAFTPAPGGLVQTADAQYLPASQFVPGPSAQPVSSARPQLVSSRPAVRPASSPRRVATREAAAAPREVGREDAPQRSWKKTALIIGGSTASGAGVGAVMGGKKGALIGAAIGGGAASIYESTKR
jgi:hypothetical protein